MIVALASLAALALPAAASAHGFDERYDLPAPLGYFVAGACATVALSFAVALLFARRAPVEQPRAFAVTCRWAPSQLALAWLGLVARVATFALFVLVMVAALAGTGDPMMNIAPTLVWIVWWVGFALLVACLGNAWPSIDPWRTTFDVLDRLAGRVSKRDGIALGWHWPASLGAWPAVLLLMSWSWLEVVYPLAAVPSRLGYAALAWTCLTLAGMVCFGREMWQRHADFFAIYFTALGRIAPIGPSDTGAPMELRVPGAALVDKGAAAMMAIRGMDGFIIAMLATVLFDGLHGGQGWLLFERALAHLVPGLPDKGGMFSGTVGMAITWLVFYVAYRATCRLMSHLAGVVARNSVADIFAPTLIPIAVAYNIAHNLSSLLIQGQNLLPLLSDPLGLQWNLFGTAHLHANIGLVDARATWTIAVAAIVTGHVVSIWLAHRVALREFGTPRAAAVAGSPLTLLMIIYTAISLTVIAEPMVTFDAPESAAQPAGK